jgi:hypothetical protein
MEDEQLKQEAEDQIWELLRKLQKIDDDNSPNDATLLCWKKENDKWLFIKLSQYGTAFHKTYGIVDGQYKIMGYEFRDSQRAFDYWKKQISRISKNYISMWDGKKICGRIFAQHEEELKTKMIALIGCFFTTLTNEGFANFDENISEKWYYEDEMNGYVFHIWTCDKNLLVKKLNELTNLLPKGLVFYNTNDFESYVEKNKKEPQIIFKK